MAWARNTPLIPPALEPAKLQAGNVFDFGDKLAVDVLASACRFGCVMKGAAGANEVPDLARNAVHIDSQTDPAIADERQPEFFFPHDVGVAGRRAARKRAGWKMRFIKGKKEKRETGVARIGKAAFQKSCIF
jgi:hypothetical protein